MTCQIVMELMFILGDSLRFFIRCVFLWILGFHPVVCLSIQFNHIAYQSRLRYDLHS